MKRFRIRDSYTRSSKDLGALYLTDYVAFTVLVPVQAHYLHSRERHRYL